MKRIPTITDLHFGSRSDSPVIYRIQEEFYQNIFWPAIDAEKNVDTILCLGDVTDRRRYVNYQTLSFTKRMFFEPAKERNIQVHWILGNHDLPFKHSLQLSSHEAFREYTNLHVYQAATIVPFDGVNTLLVPWLCEENIEHSMNMVKEFDGSVVAGHFEFSGFEMYRGMMNNHGMNPAAFRHFPLVMSGHYHHRSSRDNIFYLGSPYEMIWSDHGSRHGFHWWTPQTHDLEFVENPYHLFYTFVYNDDKQPDTYIDSLLAHITSHNITQKIIKILVKKKTQPLWYERFVDAAMQLKSHEIQFIDDTAWSIAQVQTDLDTADSLDTLSLIHQYINGLPWANSGMKDHVISHMTELYQEAIAHNKTT